MQYELTGYFLAALAGYLLYAAISGRFNTFSRPSRLQQRPAWALGLWSGSAVTCVSAGFLFAINHTEMTGSIMLATSAAWLLGVLMVPGFIAAMAYRNSINALLAEEARKAHERAVDQAGDGDIPLPDEHAPSAPLTDEQLEALGFFDAPEKSGATTEGSRAGAPARLQAALQAASLADSEAGSQARSQARARAGSQARSHPGSLAEPQVGSKARSHPESLAEPRAGSTGIHPRPQTKPQAESKAASEAASEAGSEAGSEAESQTSAHAGSRTPSAESTIEASTPHDGMSLSIEMLDDDADASDATDKTTLTIEPLDSAEPAPEAVARDDRPCREDLEDRLRNLERLNARRDEEIAALVARLQREKRRTRDDVASLARNWLLQERQLFARRSTLGRMARRAEGQLTPRLARRIARARTSDASGT